MTDYIEDIQTTQELEFSTLYFSEDTNELIMKEWQSNNLFIVFRRMKNSYVEVVKYLTFHKEKGINFIDTELEEMNERILDCEHYLNNLVKFSKKPSVMFGQFVMGELAKNEEHIEMITVLDRKINNIPEIDEVNPNIVNSFDEVIEDITKSILSTGLEETESEDNEEKILNIILNEEPTSVECDYELSSGYYGDVIMDIDCHIEFKNNIIIDYNLKVSISEDEIEEGDFMFDGEDEIECNKMSLKYNDMNQKDYSAVLSKIKDIMISNIEEPTMEDLEEHLERD